MERMSVEASGKNMRAVCKAKEAHDKTLPLGRQATEVHLACFDIERIGWEEGDVICGLVVVGDEKVATGHACASPATPSPTAASTRRKRSRRSSRPSPERELIEVGPVGPTRPDYN